MTIISDLAFLTKKENILDNNDLQASPQKNPTYWEEVRVGLGSHIDTQGGCAFQGGLGLPKGGKYHN